MNFSLQNRALGYAILVSVLIHGILMFVRFVPPGVFRIIPPDPTLEVVLVNAKSRGAPLSPEALAQANLDGGGTKEKGQSSSPLPDSGRISDGDMLASSQRRIDELQKEQKQLAAKLNNELKARVPEVRETASVSEKKPTDVTTDGSQVIAGRAAAIDRNIAEQDSRPKKVFISPRTREVGHAMYYKAMQQKIENIGTLNFPQRNGKKLYGELVVTIPVAQDGSLYEKEGGPRVERSSGNAALDYAALKIVRRAAPFGPFPPKMRSAVESEVWVIETRFRFTRDEALKTGS